MGTPQPPSAFWDGEVDPPLAQDANFKDNTQYRAYLDSQIRATQTTTLATVNGNPRFVTQLAGVPGPQTGRSVLNLDGYSSVGDGGEGHFFWDATYSGPSTPITVVPTVTSAAGCWRRLISNNILLAPWFGAKGDMSAEGIPTTDDTAAIQAMLDYNEINAQNEANVRSYVCKLPSTKFQYDNALVPSRTCYRITQPLSMNDSFENYHGNTTKHFYGEHGAQSGLYAQEFLGPMVVLGNYGLNAPIYVLDPNGSGETLCLIGPASNGPAATIAAGSDGQTLPQATIHVSATAGFPTAGAFTVDGVLIAYTNLTSNTFTGCTVANNFGEGFPTMHLGDAVALPTPLPQWCFSDYDVGDLSGVSSFTFEFFVNPCASTAWMNATYPTAWTSSLFGCGGQIGANLATHTTFQMGFDNSSGVAHLTFSLVLTGGTAIVQTSSGADHTWTANTLNHVAVCYDATHNTLRMFINGQQPDGSMTASTSGSLSQQWYESLTLCSGVNVLWPVFGGSGGAQAAPPMLLGRVRFSTTARYTSTFTSPSPSSITCDTSTRLYMDFAAASIPTRPGLQGFNIAQCGSGRYGQILPSGRGFPVWLRNFSNGVTYTRDARLTDMFFQGTGTGLYLASSTNSEVGENCFFLGLEQGIILDNFAYNSGIGPNCTFWQNGFATTTHNYLSAEIVFGHGVQFGYVSDGRQSSGSSNWHIVCVNADLRIGTGFPNSFNKGVYAFVQGASTIYMNGTTILDDQTSGFAYCGCLFAPSGGAGQASLTWNGGYIGMKQTHAAPVFLIAEAGVPVTINTTIFGDGVVPIFSFQGAGPNGGAATNVPAIFNGGNATNNPYIDASHPGPVLIPMRESFGVKTLTPSGTAAIVVGTSGYTGTIVPDDAFYREYLIGSGGWTGNQPVTWASNPGKIYVGRNNNAHSAILTTVSGAATVTVASGATFKVQDQSTGMVSL